MSDVIKSKSFHHNNLELKLIYDADLEIFHIEIYRSNNKQTFDLFGIFLDENEAIQKFDSINL